MFSNACQYALRATIYLALHASEERKIMVTTLSERLEIPRHFLAKILQQLARQDLISSVKGPQGGFYLSASNRQRTIGDVVSVMDGDGIFTDCVLGLPRCSEQHPCPLHEMVKDYRRKLNEHLIDMSIEDFTNTVIKEKIAI